MGGLRTLLSLLIEFFDFAMLWLLGYDINAEFGVVVGVEEKLLQACLETAFFAVHVYIESSITLISSFLSYHVHHKTHNAVIIK